VRAVRIKLDESAMGFSAKKREPIGIPDLSKAGHFPLKDLTSRPGSTLSWWCRSSVRRRSLGSGRQRRATGELPASTVGLMQTFADQSVVAMANARLFREIDQK
jgi:adenylate cyclase